ncbi:GntR family transcriptional regulator [Alkalilacustris brevis]|uniref:GntR family transcriptional regulator n=1 Tax=Alkalilacustris brevis TaxID=2026338 RepID=UPI000E0D0E79|nr:GntR family transcriptional regulator [Alkalilacustris brevis]
MQQQAPDHEGNPQGTTAYHRLLDEIRLGALPPGTRLREHELAQRFGVSRTPIREAIRQLEADGLVTHVPRVGAAVRSLDHAEVMELYEMRAVLEGTAARLAARAAADLELAELESLNDAMRAAGDDAARQYRLNQQFHRALMDAARNRFLSASMAALGRTMLILGPSTLGARARADEAVAEHAEILEALKRRDADAAEQHMRAHIEAAHRERLRQLRDRTTPEFEI